MSTEVWSMGVTDVSQALQVGEFRQTQFKTNGVVLQYFWNLHVQFVYKNQVYIIYFLFHLPHLINFVQLWLLGRWSFRPGDCLHVPVSVRVCVFIEPKRKRASRSSGRRLTALLSIADEGALSLLCQYEQTCISLGGEHTHIHTRSNGNNHKPSHCNQSSTLHIAMYSKPSSNKPVRKTHTFSSQYICLCHNI